MEGRQGIDLTGCLRGGDYWIWKRVSGIWREEAAERRLVSMEAFWDLTMYMPPSESYLCVELAYGK